MEDAPPATRVKAERLVAPFWYDEDDDVDMFTPTPAAPALPTVLVEPQATSVAGALLVPSDLAPLPCYHCFRAAFSGSGPWRLLRVCLWADPSVAPTPLAAARAIAGLRLSGHFGHCACRAGSRRPRGRRRVGACSAGLRVEGGAGVDGHKRGFGLSGAIPNKIKEAEYAHVAALTRSAVAMAIGGRAFLLRLRPEGAEAAAVAGALVVVVVVVVVAVVDLNLGS
ncbi:hypothetical protein Sste5344_000939 [Sporothrix stenoceras]